MRLVDDQRYIVAQLILSDQELVQVIDHFRDLSGLQRQAQLAVDVFEKAAKRDISVENIDGFQGIRLCLLEIRAQDGSFAQTNFTNNGDESLPPFDPVNDRCQSFLVAGAHEEKIGIRRDIKGFFFKLVEFVVHGLIGSVNSIK